MIDPGHPFSVPMEDITVALEDRLRYGVEQPANQVFIYKSDVSTYELGRVADSISRVSGLTGDGGYTVFELTDDYRFSNNRIIWQPTGKRPKQGVKFTVEFLYREPPAGITDFNPGSVAGTILRSMAREVKLLYEQMDQAYRRGFIDIATGVALDNVVALLGVTRTPAQKARGFVQFSVKQVKPDDIIIPIGTRVADEGGREFVTLPVSDTQDDAVLEAGELSTTVPLEAVIAGPDGNVNADTITLMPTPPTGVAGVNNAEHTEGGKEAEDDDNLRERARHALEQAGKATLNAIRFAVLEVPGVDDVQVLDQSVDETIPLGEVQVRYSGTTEAEEVLAAVENTRSAGILARLAEVNLVLISGVVYVIPESQFDQESIDTFTAEIADYIRSLKIGDPLSQKKMNSAVYLTAGLADVAETQLIFEHLEDPMSPGSFIDGDVITDPFFVGKAEQLNIASPAPSVSLVRKLSAVGVAPGPGNYEFTLSLQDQDDADIVFRSFTLDVTGVMVAYLLSNDQPETIGTFSVQAIFTISATASVVLSTGGFDPLRHKPEVEVNFSAKAYPGIEVDDATVEIVL
jgi:phage-related baseplate assembly protein